MQIPNKALIIAFNILIFLALLAVNLQADGEGNNQGVGISRQKAPAKMLSLRNPYAGSSEESGKAGLKLFRRHCASCHEKSASAANCAPSLDTPAIRTIPPGYLFWYLKNGNLRHGMPAWSSLPDERLWQLVTYLQEVESDQGIASRNIH